MVLYLAEHDVRVVEPRAVDGGQEELRAVGVGPRVGHRQDADAFVLQLERFVGKLVAVNALATDARAVLIHAKTSARRISIATATMLPLLRGHLLTVKSPPWHIKLGMMRWNLEPL